MGETEPAEKKEGVEVEVVMEMVEGECVDGGELVMCWEGEDRS